MPLPARDFEGLDNRDGALPPEIAGAVGPAHYVEWVNFSFQIWDKTGTSVYGPASGNSLWQGFGGACETSNDGGAIVLYDELAGRWLMSQGTRTSIPYLQCVAVSTTSDPTGPWNRYAFEISDAELNLFPRMAVWPDAYYMSAERFQPGIDTEPTWSGVGVYAFERAKMLDGLPASIVSFGLPAESGYHHLVPSDLDGRNSPPVNSPNYFAAVDDDAWGIFPTDRLHVWEFQVNWTEPGSSTFTGPTELDTAPFDATMCSITNSCIPQPGTDQGLDMLQYRLMGGLQYRNFGDHESLVANHSVDVDGNHSGIRWYEIRDPGGTPTIYQQGTYSPDADNRWTGSAAMDKNGNVALGYSVSSGITYPSIRYAGRLSTDPLGTLPQTETTVIDGTGAQTDPTGAWGLNSSMTVDPVDDCTFWYAQQYVATTGYAAWRTRIASFEFPSCDSVTGTLYGTVHDATTVAPIAGARVTADSGRGETHSAISASNGGYTLTLPVGTYTVTTSAREYAPGTLSSVVVTTDTTTILPIPLTHLPSYVVSGTIKDSNTQWPLYARVSIGGYPGGGVWSNPTTGFYSVTLYGSTVYTANVTSWSGSYTPLNRAIGPYGGNSTENLILDADPFVCNAPGYQGDTAHALLFESFDSATTPNLPSGWAIQRLIGTTADWSTRSGLQAPPSYLAPSPPNVGYFNSFYAYPGDVARLHRTSGLDLSSAAPDTVLSFWMYHDIGADEEDQLQMQVSVDGGVTWQDAGTPFRRYDGSTGWKKHEVGLGAFVGAGKTDVRLGILGISGWGQNIYIDDIFVGTLSCTPPTGGLVVGTVRDANTGALLPGTRVGNVIGQHTSTAFTQDQLVDDSFYVMFSPVGQQPVIATRSGYGPVETLVDVVQGGTVRQDFFLPSGNLSFAPSSLTLTVAHGVSATAPITINNSGGISSTFGFTMVPILPSTLSGLNKPMTSSAISTVTAEGKGTSAASSGGRLTASSPTVGQVIRTWPTNLTNGWGIGYNLMDDDLWLSNPAVAGGDNRNYRFLPNGTWTGDTIDVSDWVAMAAGDMTYNPFTATFWQLNVDGDSCIYELDPASKVSTGNKICPKSGIATNGLTYDPLTDTYFAGSLSGMNVMRFDSSGTVVESRVISLTISGLAYNPSTGHLFVLANPILGPEIHVLDVNNNYTTVGRFRIPGLNSVQGAGLTIDCDGNLWVVNPGNQTVLEVDSGETGVCAWANVPWLIASPASGSIPSTSSQSVNLTLDSGRVTAPGNYRAMVRIRQNTPYSLSYIPITLTVSPIPTGLLRGSVRDANTSSPIVGARVAAMGQNPWQTSTAVSGPDGAYSLTLPSGTYTVTATASTYVPNVIADVSVNSGATTTLNISLTPALTYVVSGTVSDSTTGWPLYASINIFGTAGRTIWTNPATGYYSFTAYANEAYNLYAAPWADGYEPLSRSTGPITGNRTENLPFSADPAACVAPGYQSGTPNPIFTERFDGVAQPGLPPGWATADLLGTSGEWFTNAGSHYPSGQPARSGPNVAYFNSHDTVDVVTRLYRTTGLDLSGESPDIALTFWMLHDRSALALDYLQVQVSTNGGIDWQDVGSLFLRLNTSIGWQQHAVDLSAFTGPGNNDVRIGFIGYSDNGSDIHIDDIQVGRITCAPGTGGLVVGRIYDASSGAPLANASVRDDGGRSTRTTSGNAPGSDPFYVLFSPTGQHTFTSSLPGYSNVNATTTVVQNNTIQQDFYLPAANLSSTVQGISLTLTFGENAFVPVPLNNTGVRGVNYASIEIPVPRGSQTAANPTIPSQTTAQPQTGGKMDQSAANSSTTPQTTLSPQAIARDGNSDIAKLMTTPKTFSTTNALKPAAASGVTSSSSSPARSPGTVVQSWPTGLPIGWGIGYNTLDNDVWVNNLGILDGLLDSEDHEYRFTTNGVMTGDSIETPADWGLGADMAYNPLTGKFWQVQVDIADESCIYEFDPKTRSFTGNQICIPSSIPQLGLAFDPLSNTFYSGSLIDGTIIHFDTSGRLLDSKQVDLSITGLAFNPSTGHLFVMNLRGFSPDVSDVYVLDVNRNYALVNQFNIDGFGILGQGGLEIDCDGDLWTVNWVTQQVIEAASGEPGGCSWTEIPWLDQSRTAGTVPSGGNQTIYLSIDTTIGITRTGQHLGRLHIRQDSPYPSISVPITLTVNPGVVFWANSTSGISPLTVEFTQRSLGETTGWQWYFGDGGTSTTRNPTYTFNSKGTHDVIVVARGPSWSNARIRTGYITVYEPVKADFTVNTSAGPAPFYAEFANKSAGDYTSSWWDFGDGSTSDAANPTHWYNSPGTYAVSLTVNGPGGTDTKTRTSYVTVYQPAVSAFHATQSIGVRPLVVSFSNDSTGDFTSSLWDFGDGTTSTERNPSHTYTAKGSYTVKLTVSGRGGTNTSTRISYVTVYDPVVLGFWANTTSGLYPLAVMFNNYSSGDFTTWLWDFGDGTTSTERSPAHTYNAKGTYTVSLSASGPGGSSSKIMSNYILVYGPADAAFIAAPTTGQFPLTVAFTNKSTGDYTSYLWDFGDGTTSTEVSPTHVYQAPGTYTVTLRGTGPGGSDRMVRAGYITAISIFTVYLPAVSDVP